MNRNPKRQYISVCGYGSTGSSAVVNLLEEVSGCHVAKGEFRFIQDPDGLEDLCNNLENSWGWVRSDAFVRRFLKYTDVMGRYPTLFSFGEGLDRRFNGKFFKYRNEFLNEIIDTKWNGYWFYHDYHERNKVEVFIEHIKRQLRKVGVSKRTIRKMTKKSDMYFVRHDTDIYTYAGQFLEKLFDEVLHTDETKIVLDQLILPYNNSRFRRIIKNLKSIVVDRDPRDVFLDAKTYNAYPITSDINTFISFYESVHSKEQVQNSGESLYVKFEDLIYKYEKTIEKIFHFLEIEPSEHVRKNTRLVVEKSAKNTQTWKRTENIKYMSDIKKIEKKLKKWCYDFE
ncbi:MAG: sulfotransferase domain-containing protein [Bacteriovoracaceae bacterium]|jgi:hypothetical protein|nr:sulfotransferase domain-containing protein [Bacteriovoracaceae bacterium]